jgi:hypothetical protein
MNFQIIEIEEPTSGHLVEHIIIDHGDGSFTSMPKSTYDEMKKAKDEAETL